MTELPPLRDVIARHDLGAKRSLGQNFLLDGNLCDRIARSGGDPSTAATVIEIGPGPGGLTRALLRTGAPNVVVVEKDPRCIAVMEELAAAFPGRLTIQAGDALQTDVAAIGEAPRQIVANLPYNIATPLLIGWLRQAEAFDSLTLMFQKEVADRLTAQPHTKAYGRLSVITQWQCVVRPLFNIDRRAFVPPPKVTSTVVHLAPRAEALAPARWESLEKVTAAAFGQRRKMLRSSLRALGLDPTTVGIDPERRAEDLSVEEFCTLARALD